MSSSYLYKRILLISTCFISIVFITKVCKIWYYSIYSLIKIIKSSLTNTVEYWLRKRGGVYLNQIPQRISRKTILLLNFDLHTANNEKEHISSERLKCERAKRKENKRYIATKCLLIGGRFEFCLTLPLKMHADAPRYPLSTFPVPPDISSESSAAALW